MLVASCPHANGMVAVPSVSIHKPVPASHISFPVCPVSLEVAFPSQHCFSVIMRCPEQIVQQHAGYRFQKGVGGGSASGHSTNSACVGLLDNRPRCRARQSSAPGVCGNTTKDLIRKSGVL